MALTAVFTDLVDLVFPPRCPLCGAALAQADGLCAGCWGALAIPGKPCCRRCQRPFAQAEPHGRSCAICRADPPLHDGIAAATLYNDASRRLVLGFKHGERIALTPLLARLMAARLTDVGAEWLVVPVPLHRWRLWRRGYNQSALLARAIARAKGATLLVDALQRHRATPTLGGLGVEARALALAGAIRVDSRRAAALSGRDVVLVDDVLTSGATSQACVAVLKQAGAARVMIACFARVLDEALPEA